MSAYLIEHPPARSQFRTPRRKAPSGVIVVHTAESTPDFVAFDGGAEAVANFIRGRTDPGSYHDLVDSDSCINLVPYGSEAFHDGTGSNPHSLSVSVATRADVWPLAPLAWRDGAIEQAAQAATRQAAWVKAQTGIVVPSTRITRDESELRVPGFISHGQRDPARRTDPGKDFPWSQFLARFAELTGGTPATPQEDDMPKATFIRVRTDPRVYLAGVGMDPRPVARFKDAEYHAAREGVVILNPPTDGDEDVTDGAGTVRKVMVVDDGSLFGI